jgi:4-hydroxythreonine-4-phosphate dehydrogenase
LPAAAPPPVLAFTQGDPAGVGPEILLKLVTPQESAAGASGPAALVSSGGDGGRYLPLLIAERAALDALRLVLPAAPWHLFAFLESPPDRSALLALAERGRLPVLDPVAKPRPVEPGTSTAADAGGAMAALDAAIALASAGAVDAVVTAPVSKESIARHHLPGFVGHTDYLARACGLERYGRDYLMAFLAPGQQVALLSTHLPLRRALDAISPESIGEALDCLHRHAGGSVAVAGFNPHAGEGGLLGGEDRALVAPAVEAARRRGIDAHGPESPDSLFARMRKGEFDWVLALYHDQGLIAVKTAAFGLATNWTLGLPWLRTSVDHGTAFSIAGRGVADDSPLRAVVRTTLDLLLARR